MYIGAAVVAFIDGDVTNVVFTGDKEARDRLF